MSGYFDISGITPVFRCGECFQVLPYHLMGCSQVSRPSSASTGFLDEATKPLDRCVKCGSTTIYFAHISARPDCYIPGSDADQNRAEHLRHTCARCHYCWTTPCLDSTEVHA